MLTIELYSDFFDSFEARGVKRLKRGTLMEPTVVDNCIELGYLGLDEVTRTTAIRVSPEFQAFRENTLEFRVELAETERKTFRLDLTLTESAAHATKHEPVPEIAKRPKPEWFDQASRITVGNAQVQAIVERSIDDLQVLLMEYRDFWVPAAGLPRFAVPFGRDCLITGLMTLLWNPTLSRDVLRFMAKTQGKTENPWNYEQPGKIMHEMHTGELAHLGEIPFGLFYGSVDSTPLFLVLAAEYLRWTGDMELFRELKTHFDRAWEWITTCGDLSGRGYLEYKAHTPPKVSSAALTVGLFNQGWKDSATAVMYHDGRMVTDHPIALAEVQGALYRALRLWGDLYVSMPESEGVFEEGRKLLDRSQRLKTRFNQEFWMEDRQFYAMALDGNGKQVDSITSNPGHCLWARLLDDERAPAVARTLMNESMFAEWGIRTMSSTEPAYNPFSYHNGSIWPFENAMIASGLKKYGLVQETQQVFDALVEASLYFEYRRWPEVYCGVGKTVGGVLARQPDASRPQAWSAASIFLLVQTILGIAPSPFSGRVDITPALPSCMNEILVEGINIAGGRLSLRLVRENNGVLMEVRDNPDGLDLVLHPATRHTDHLLPGRGPAVSG